MLMRALMIAGLTLLPSLAGAQTVEPGPAPHAANAESPDPALASYLSANGLLNRGLHDLAAAEYRLFLAAHAAHEKAPLARYGLAVCLVRLNQPADAAPLLKELRGLRDFPFAAEVAVLSGQCLLATEHFAEAADAFADAEKRFPQHDLADDSAAGLVEAQHRGGEHAAAIAACRSFVDSHSQSPLLNRVEFLGALSEMATGDHAAAGARFARVASREPDGPFAEQATFFGARCAQQAGTLASAEPGYRAIIARPQSRYRADALYGLAGICSVTERIAEAGELLDRLLADHADTPLAAAARFERARVCFAQDQFDRALTLFDQARREPGELADDAAYWAAKCRLRQGEVADAAERLADAIKESPRSNLAAEMAYDRAVALSRGDRPADAAKLLAQFLRNYASHALAADALYLLATCEHQTKDYERSLARCELFLKDHAQHAQAAAVRLLIADNAFAAGSYERAADEYARVLAGNPAEEIARRATLRRGLALYQIEKFDEAQAALDPLVGLADREAAFRPALLALGDIAFRRSEWSAAEARFARYAEFGKDAPSADDALLKLAVARQRQGKHADAIAASDRLLSEFPASAHRCQAQFERGQALAALNRDADAATAFESLLRDEGAAAFRAYALYHLGVLARRDGHAARAAERFGAVLQTKPEAPLAADARFQRALALLAIPNDADAVEALGEFVASHGGDDRAVEARARLALALVRLERHAAAQSALEQLADADLAALDGGLRTALQFERAAALKRAGKSDEAAAALRSLASAEGPLRVYAALELAEIEMAARRFDVAAAVLRDACPTSESQKLPPDVVEPLRYRLGVCAFETKQWDDACKAFEELLTAAPESKLAASAAFFAGEAHYQAGRPTQAAEYLTKSVERYGAHADGAAALLRLGECAAALQQWARSEQVFSDYLARFTASESAYQARFGVAWARENLGRFDEAIDAYREVVAKHKGPTAARAQFQIGECLFAKKQYDEAVRELLKVDILYAYPEWSAAALYEAGRCFEALRKDAEARAQFKQVVEKHADTRWATLARERLAQPADAPPGK